VAFWDNRAVQHYASSGYFPDVRIMERAAIIGDRPRADGLVPSTVSSNRPGVV
jgi:alpha-ketoglutarate-dependent taurine dioxygenase